MEESEKTAIDKRPISSLVKFLYVLAAICFLWAIIFGILMLSSPVENYVHGDFKNNAVSGIKGVIFMGGLGFVLDK